MALYGSNSIENNISKFASNDLKDQGVIFFARLYHYMHKVPQKFSVRSSRSSTLMSATKVIFLASPSPYLST